MLYLVISTPGRSRTTQELIAARLAFRKWIKGLNKRVISFYPRAGRGAVVIIDIGSRKGLDRLIAKWRTFVRTRLDVYPLENPAASKRKLEKALRRFKKGDH